MKLSTIRYFCKVARSRSIREAAEELHISASAISRTITQLEDELEQQLLERQARGVKLTQAGEIVHQRFHEILLNLETVREELDDLQGMHRGKIRIATLEGAVTYLLPKAIAEFHRHYPGISFEILTGDVSQAVEAVLQDEAEVLIAFNVPENPQISILARVDLPLYAVMSPRNPLRKRKSVSLKDAGSMEAGYLTENHGTRRLLDQVLGKYGIVPRRTLVTNSIETLKAFVRHGLGITFLPKFTVEREVHNNELLIVPVEEASLVTAQMVIGTRRHRPIAKATEELIERIKTLLFL